MNALLICLTAINLNMPRSANVCYYANDVVEASQMYGVDADMLVSLIHHESRWNPNLRSRTKDCGLTQVNPRWSDFSCNDLFVPRVAIFEGARKLRYWVHKYGRGRWEIGLCGYNVGYQCKGPTPHPRGIRYGKFVKRYTKKFKRHKKRLRKQLKSKIRPKPKRRPRRPRYRN